MFKTDLLLFVGILNISVALIVLSRNVRKTLNLIFAVFAIAVALWVLGIDAFLSTNSSNLALSWAKVYYLAPLLIVISSVLFADVFPSGGAIQKRKAYLTVLGFTGLAVPLLFFHGFLFVGLIYHSWGKEVVLKGLPYTLYSIYLGLAFTATLLPIYRKRKTEHGIYRSQATVFFFGYLTSCLLGLFFNLILPALGNYRLIWIGPSTSTVYIVATAYGIVRHKLFDLRWVAARAVGYSLSIVVLVSVYGGVVFIIVTKLLSGEVASLKERAVSAALAVIMAVTFAPTKRFFDRVTNKLFYQDAYNAQAFIDQLNKVLVENIRLDSLLEDAARVIGETLKAEYCLFGIKETQFRDQRIIGTMPRTFSPRDVAYVRHLTPQLDAPIVVTDNLEKDQERLRQLLAKNDIAVLARLTPESNIHQEGLGYLVFGPKRSGNPYNGQDVKIIGIVAKELFIAIQNALHFEEIENFNVTLEHRIEAATRKLRRTNEKLKLLDETKDDFISMASHQLRTPLTSVKGYVSMVLDGDAGKINGMQRKLLGQSFISAQRMVYLISDLLNVSRLKTGKFVIEPIASNLAKVVKDEVDQLQDTAKGRNLELVFDKPEHFPTLMLDETKIRQVIMNFIDNAIYYTPSGGHITVRLVEKPQTIEFTVQDDGIGVPKYEQHHLFSKFYRAENAKRARPDGTGLGLFMAKKVIIAQGGATIFKSQQHKGSTFGFNFAKSALLPSDPTVLGADLPRK